VIDAIGPRTKLVAVTHLSNVLGTKVDVKAICAGARAKGVPVLVDGSQAAVHMPVDVQDIGCDFYAITGHKLYGPSGSGAIWIAGAHGRDAPLHRRRRHDPRGHARHRHLQRPADEVRGRHARHRPADRAWRRARLHDGSGHGRDRGA
jgi:kynureninase